ncbi:DUF6314 family protein [Salinisphaera hydrothermalis]|uniref:DUF6314 domain-containing protein n=1 Tax=Salinisphaera hydrothermalis (strain C41B8) TaxID=1304275 RepID=A0A084IKA3_SALHC|nr:DUF6314 family protein [Salinisphaera hydrothermalis]KEZ77137.1 hypothetical protein C41B8_11128 [Salinisphaera hydrothermalis C41B8]
MTIAAAADNEGSDAIIRAWQCLPGLRSLSFTAEPGPASQTDWRGRGTAGIRTERAGNDWRLIERGRFVPAGAARGVTMNNVYRWQRVGDRLRLYHERFGTDAAVFLFELVAESADRLICQQPHLCGDDVYRGTLVLAETGFDLDWSITGPRKDEHLHYRYRGS